MTIQQSRHLRRFSLAVLTFLVWIWAFSLHLSLYYHSPVRGWSWGFKLLDGELGLVRLANFHGGLGPFVGWGIYRPGKEWATYTFLPRPTLDYGLTLPSLHYRYGRFFSLWVPVWTMMTPFGVLLGLSYWTERRQRRLSVCSACGYDLTGNVSGICPECGTPIPEDVRQDSGVKADEPSP